MHIKLLEKLLILIPKKFKTCLPKGKSQKKLPLHAHNFGKEIKAKNMGEGSIKEHKTHGIRVCSGQS